MMVIVGALIDLAMWLLMVDSADDRDGMPKGYRRRFARLLYRVILAGLLGYFVYRAYVAWS